MPVKLAITKRHVITVAIINKTCELMNHNNHQGGTSTEHQ